MVPEIGSFLTENIFQEQKHLRKPLQSKRHASLIGGCLQPDEIWEFQGFVFGFWGVVGVGGSFSVVCILGCMSRYNITMVIEKKLVKAKIEMSKM